MTLSSTYVLLSLFLFHSHKPNENRLCMLYASSRTKYNLNECYKHICRAHAIHPKDEIEKNKRKYINFVLPENSIHSHSQWSTMRSKGFYIMFAEIESNVNKCQSFSVTPTICTNARTPSNHTVKFLPEIR